MFHFFTNVMVATGYLTDARRAKIRRKTGVGFLEDYFLRSEIGDYRRLRLLVNLIVGVLFCSSLYYLGWKRLNFADFHYVYGVIFKWTMILSTACAFSLSPMFRCAMLCVLFGAMGKNGQAPLSLLILDNLNDGPISNIVSNYQRTAEILLCHLELQAKIASNRVSMLTGPVEAVLEKQIEIGLQMLRDLIKKIRSIITPFLAEVKASKTSEDKNMEERDDQLNSYAQRKAMKSLMKDEQESEEQQKSDEKESLGTSKENADKLLKTKPAWTEFKTSQGRQIAKRIAKRCNDVFIKGVDKCRDLMSSVKDKCYEAMPWYLMFFVCPKLNAEEACNIMQRRIQSLSVCQKHMANAQMSSSMEGDVNDVVNITDEMDNELQANLHLLLVEMPRLENVFQVTELKMFVSIGANYVKVVLKTVSKVIQALFIFYVYIIFRDSVQMIENYKTDVDFNNCFITSEFWQIDHHRELLGQQAIRYISSSEMRNWKLMNVFSAPTRAELDRAKGALMSWFVTTFVAALLVFMDYYLYAFLNAVVSASHTKIEQLGSSSAAIEVEGDGVVAQFVRAMIADNRTVEVDSSMTNAHCLMPPQRPNFQHIFTWIALPLIISLLLQVIFSFVVKRVIINHFMAFMFPLRDRIRIIYLYNKVLFMRLKHRQESRARIRFIVDRWKINEEYDEGGWLSYRSWFKLNVLDRLFKTGQCLMCQQNMRPANLYFCVECPATFCKYCLIENAYECYACQVEEGLVNTERSLVTYAENEKANEQFVRGGRSKKGAG
ncbi:hypothetical protein Y032_0046g1405 [Ancylostoma ceylanicum]|uniref:Dendritic cell-specific transmembrane protein-like domain-containing protein n=2 Tax=Ancylostoma ceylanicum TaxID=53326 RepID=A0A016UD23_9BILA|nr:hypothetical protein Y032_0046g1405 [Ancylostoma ceylanicum]